MGAPARGLTQHAGVRWMARKDVTCIPMMPPRSSIGAMSSLTRMRAPACRRGRRSWRLSARRCPSGVRTLTQPTAPEAKITGSPKGFQWVVLGLERAPGVLKGVQRGPVGPPGPLGLSALLPTTAEGWRRGCFLKNSQTTSAYLQQRRAHTNLYFQGGPPSDSLGSCRTSEGQTPVPGRP